MSGITLTTVFALLENQLIGIPTTSPLAWVYGIINIILLLYATLFPTSTTSTTTQ